MKNINTVTEYRLRAFNQCQDSWEKRAKARKNISDLGHIVRGLEKEMQENGTAERIVIRTDHRKACESKDVEVHALVQVTSPFEIIQAKARNKKLRELKAGGKSAYSTVLEGMEG